MNIYPQLLASFFLFVLSPSGEAFFTGNSRHASIEVSGPLGYSGMMGSNGQNGSDGGDVSLSLRYGDSSFTSVKLTGSYAGLAPYRGSGNIDHNLSFAEGLPIVQVAAQGGAGGFASYRSDRISVSGRDGRGGRVTVMVRAQEAELLGLVSISGAHLRERAPRVERLVELSPGRNQAVNVGPRLELTRTLLVDQNLDGRFSANEKIQIRSITVKNTGDFPVERGSRISFEAKFQRGMMDPNEPKKIITLAAALPPGESKVIDLDDLSIEGTISLDLALATDFGSIETQLWINGTQQSREPKRLGFVIELPR